LGKAARLLARQEVNSSVWIFKSVYLVDSGNVQSYFVNL